MIPSITKNNKSRRSYVVIGKIVIVTCLLLSMFHYGIVVVWSNIQSSSSLLLAKTPSTSTMIKQRSYLMIVAHPDDEAIWGGEFLVENGSKTHVVVTLGDSKYVSSNENKKIRYQEFSDVANVLDYSPEFLYGRDRFEYKKRLHRSIRRRIRQLICDQSWDKIITHGPEGEYGHPGHHNVYDAVSESIQYCCYNSNKLYVFHSTPPPTNQQPSSSSVGVEETTTGWSKTKITAIEKYISQRNVLLNLFLGWKESIVPIKQYNYTLASKACLSTPVARRFCRIHNYIDSIKQQQQQQHRATNNKLAKEYHLFYGLNGETLIHENQFHHKGVAGSC